MKELIISLIGAAVTGLFGFIGKKILDYLESKYEIHIKKETVKTCVEAVEQLYHDLQGPEKLERCKANVIQMLQQKGVEITELELNMYIEAVVGRFNYERLWGAANGNAEK
ncbi:MAG: hypothetical protein IJR33_08485 [Clostridia bacterium]|nr:hypothetical protein [Clostridia bacterium]